MVKSILDYTLLIAGFLFTYLVPGLFIINNFFPKLSSRVKIALVPVISVITSTYLVYFLSLIIGFTRYSILLSFLSFCPWLIYFLVKDFKPKSFRLSIRKHFIQLFLGFSIFVIFFLALYPGIFTTRGGSIIMSSVNWQDTAMHQGIVESIAQGNFPPQAPYYAGVPLNYYYFTDFHSAILVNLFGRFFPRVIVYTNPLFATAFAMALYALSYEVTRKKEVAVVSSLGGVFFGNMMFIHFWTDLYKILPLRGILPRLANLLANKSYSMEYEKVFQMSSMGDYFLQNRPMMIGLPAITLTILFLIRGLKKERLNEIFLAGIITGALIKFQYFGIVIGFLVFGLSFLIFFRLKKIHFFLKVFFVFFLPIILISLPFIASTSMNGKSLLSVIQENFSLGPWERGKALSWYLIFILGNFSLGFVLSLFSILDFKKLTRSRILLYVLFVVLGTIPFITRFTVYKGDMFKFWYYMVIPISILAPLILTKIFHRRGFLVVSLVVFLIITSFSSVLTLVNSALNQNVAYNQNDVTVGLWIRQNTLPKSVFIGMPTVHTPISQIGGRLRVLSYINWPYSHGYNTGEDNVFRRLEDIKKVYRVNDVQVVKEIIKSYNADYIFYGSEERDNFPEAPYLLNNLGILKLVYDRQGNKIYEVLK
jgi:uncharacterized membrane protein